ncbi:MAG: hypothetical protein H7252_02455 [Cytophaga sp.]|nr:hypothetical protein [Undibacterium sp.]
MRQRLVKFRTMRINGLCDLLTEYGEVMGLGSASLNKPLPEVLVKLVERLPVVLIDTLSEQSAMVNQIDGRIAERELTAW